MDFTLIFAWWNLVFLVPMALAMVYMGVYVLTGFGADGPGDLAEADADADLDAHAEADVDADAAADVGVNAGAGAEAGAEAMGGGHSLPGSEVADHHGSAEHARPLADVLARLGVGRVPLSLVLVILAMVWGMAGFSANRMMYGAGMPQWLIPLLSLPLALGCSLILTGWMARGIARFMPMDQTSVGPTDALIGSSALSVSAIDGNFGMAQVRGRSGDLIQIPCRVAGDRPPIEKGQRVRLVDYNNKDRFFYVVADEAGRLRNQ